MSDLLETGPGGIVEGRVVVQLVDGPDDVRLAFLDPTGVVRPPVGQGGDLGRGQPHPVGEEGHVHAPLVFAATPCAGPVDDELAIPHGQRQPPAELVRAPAPHGLGHGQVLHERPEQGDGWHAGRHHLLQLPADGLGVGGRHRHDPRSGDGSGMTGSCGGRHGSLHVVDSETLYPNVSETRTSGLGPS